MPRNYGTVTSSTRNKGQANSWIKPFLAPNFIPANQFTITNSQKFSIADNATFSNAGHADFCYCGWVVFDAVNVQQCIVAKSTSITGTTCEFALFMQSSGIPRMSISNGTTTTSANWSAALTAGVPYFIEGYYDSTNNRIRINVNRGTSIGTAQSTGGWDSTFALNFGSSGSADYLGGRMWSWGFFNALPSSTNLNTIYNSGAGKRYADLTAAEKTNLVAWWDFSEASGNAMDKTGTGNNLTPSASRPTSTQALASTVTITSPVANQVVQRRIGQSIGDITITGAYYGQPQAIEASFNGGAYLDISATGNNGIFTGILKGQPVANGGSVSVRHKSNNSISASQAIGGLGIVIALLGQSNCSGRGTNNQIFMAGLANAFMLGNDYVLKTLVDPTDSSTSQVDTVSNDSGAGAGSIWPLVATSLVSTNAVPIMFIPCAKGSTAISAWQPGVNHQDRTTLYGSAVYRSLLYGGVEFGGYWQGETDAQSGLSQAAFKAAADTLVAAWNADTGTKLMIAKIQNCTAISSGNQANINNAIGQEWSGNVNVLTGPDLSGISTDSPDGLHLWADSKLLQAANLWIPVIKTATGLV